MKWFIPQRPTVTHKSTPEEVAKAVNRLLDKPSVLALLDESTIKTLRTGKLHDRIDAIYVANYAQLEEARQGALQSVATQYLHKSQQEALAFIKAEQGMSREDRNLLIEALVSCKNFEKDMEQAVTLRPKSAGPKKRHSSSRRRVAIAS